jgi:hypothetical protein
MANCLIDWVVEESRTMGSRWGNDTIAHERLVMDPLSVRLALHGAVVLTISLIAGLLLHKAIRLERPVGPWHLAHAGVSGRGVMLLALAPVLGWLAVPTHWREAFVWLILTFAWSSTAAMVIAAATGFRGVTWTGSVVSRLVFILYVTSAVAAFPAVGILMVGLWRAW